MSDSKLVDCVIVALVRGKKDQSFLFAKALAIQIGIPLHIFLLDRYADGESFFSCTTIKELQGKFVFVIDQYSYHGSQDLINAQVLELLFALDVIKRANAQSIELFAPYLPYARHDVSDFSFGLGLIATLFSFLQSIGVEEVYACDVHEPAITERLSQGLTNLSLDGFWADVLTNLGFNTAETVLASPDFGGLLRVQKVAKRLGLEYVLIKKERYNTDKTRVISLEGSVQNKNVVILDDIIDTAGTAINAALLLIERGARDVIGCFSHGVFSSGSIQRLNTSAFSKIYTTNTILSAENCASSKIIVLPLQSFIAKHSNTFFKRFSS